MVRHQNDLYAPQYSKVSVISVVWCRRCWSHCSSSIHNTAAVAEKAKAEKLAKVYINPRILSCFEQSFKSVVKFPSSVTKKVQNSKNSKKWGEVELGVGEETNLIYFINIMVSLFNLPRQEFLDCDCYHCETSMVFRVTIAIEWMVWKKPLVPMVFQWFLVYQPLAPMVF